MLMFFFFQAEDGIRDVAVTGVQTCALPIYIHQQDTDGSRLFLPPYLDPIEPNVDPLLVDGANALGTAIAWELAGQGKTGISINAIYDAWTPARAYQHYHGGVRILSEAADANLASPIDVPFDQLAVRARGFNPRERSEEHTSELQSRLHL